MTIPHYGKREPGGLTASSPGDTLYFAFASYNDSGDSEALTGLAVTDIEVFKNGNATTRATDSGYSLISDTGQIGDRVGLYRFSVQLFNTADDTGHYESGAWYQVAVDSVGIDGKTVRFWVGSFEIGRQRVDVRALVGDTGAANYLKNTYANGFADTGLEQRLAQIQSDVDTGIRTHVNDLDTGLHDTLADYDTGIRAQIAAQDTGFVSNAVWNSLRSAHVTAGSFGESDTGVNQRLGQIQSDVDTGLRAHISDVDTGLHDTLADYDTGVRAILQTTGVNVTRIDSDTGAADQLGKAFATTPTYFQQVDVQLVDADTGAATHLQQLVANGFHDTGLNDNLGRIRADVDTGLRAQISDVDTGLHSVIANQDTGFTANAVWNALRSAHTTAGTFGQYVLGDVQLIDGDTGAATHLQQATAASGIVLSNVTQLGSDTGALGWLKNTFANGFNDTGLNDHLGRIRSDVDTGLRDAMADLDTGLRDYIDNTDTGLRAFIDDLDTGIKQRFNALAEDTGGVNINAIQGDTGAAGWLRAAFTNGFHDTGLNDRIGRVQSDVDTGLRDTIADLDTGLRSVLFTAGVNVTQIVGDTGAASRLKQFAGEKLSTVGMVDTGTLAGTQPGTINANVTHVNETAVQGNGSPGNEWRPE
jgi:hypothetical protein